MIPRSLMWLACLSALTLGCKHHLLFVEGSQLGLKAKVSPQGTAPAEFTLGYRRGIVAILPKRGAEASCDGCPAPPDGAVPIPDDKNELMSLYTVFRANVGFNDDTYVCHFTATGRAAVYLAASDSKLKQLGDELCGTTATNGKSSEKPEGGSEP